MEKRLDSLNKTDYPYCSGSAQECKRPAFALACEECNRKKGNRTAAEFGHPEIQAHARLPLKDAAAVNATRWTLWRRLSQWGLPVETGSGGRTKYNRTRQDLPKTHWLDASCVGQSGEAISVPIKLSPLCIKAYGHGTRQMCRVNQFGFPRTGPKGSKIVYGFQTGDIVRAVVTNGKKTGTYLGRVAVRSSGYFNIQSGSEVVQGISWKYCQSIHRVDGYAYSFYPKEAGIPPLV